MAKILIIEDDAIMREELARLLGSSGHEAVVLPLSSLSSESAALKQPFVLSPAQLVQQIIDAKASLLLLDINLPGLNGVAILKALRAQSDLPVIMVTGNVADADQVLSMSFGADDYITKPYNPNILLLRIAAVLKRSESSPSLLEFRGLKIDLGRGIIERLSSAPAAQGGRRSERILLTKNEMIILGHLLGAKGQIVTRDALMTDLWNNHEYINDNALTVNISRLRHKLGLLGASDAITTRKGLGYVLA